jgi:hypothetical protein
MSWYSLPDWVTGYDAANADAAAKADAKRQELDQRAWAAGKIDTAEAQRRAAAGYGVDKETQREEIDDAFGDSVKDNAKAMSKSVSDTVGFAVWNILGAVPPVVWGLGLIALFLYMGGGVWLKGAINRRR